MQNATPSPPIRGDVGNERFGVEEGVAPLIRSNPIGGSESDPGCSVTNYYKLRTLSFFITI